MHRHTLPRGTVHQLPSDLQTALSRGSDARHAWTDVTPLARNEWICWVESAKHIETRDRRVTRTVAQLTEGKRRPCCWAGCVHREKTGV